MDAKPLRIPVLLTMVWTASCGPLAPARSEGRPVSEAYAEGHELRVLDVDSPLKARKQVPVLSTPEVFAAYVPAHPERDLLIGEHWVFFKLRDAEWFTERLQDPDPPATSDANPEDLKPLSDMDWSKVVIPHK